MKRDMRGRGDDCPPYAHCHLDTPLLCWSGCFNITSIAEAQHRGQHLLARLIHQGASGTCTGTCKRKVVTLHKFKYYVFGMFNEIT